MQQQPAKGLVLMQHPKCFPGCIPSFPKALRKRQRHACGHTNVDTCTHMNTHAQLSLATHHTLHCPGAAADPKPSSPTSQDPPGCSPTL